jgi:tetratricopeptide (TPR) repeat protein
MRSDALDDSARAEEFRRLEENYRQEERWEDLAAMFIERTEAATSSEERAGYLIRAAQIFEANLDDADRAFITLLAALPEDPSNEELSDLLARLSTEQNRWHDLLSESQRLVAEIGSDTKRADLLVTLAGWYRDHLEEPAEAEKSLEAALKASPAHPAALRPLVTFHSQRNEWAVAAEYLTAASGSTDVPQARTDWAIEAAEIYRHKLNDMESAAEQYRFVLALAPGQPKATAALADISWEKKDWAAALPLFDSLAETSEKDAQPSSKLWQRAGWAAQMTGDFERARASYQRSHAIDPRYLPTLLCWSQLAEAHDWTQDILQVVPQMLVQAEAKLTAVEKAEHLMALGEAHMALGDAKAAAESLMKAYEQEPDLPDLREALAEANSKMEGGGPGNAKMLVEQNRALLAGASSPDERFEILCTIGQLQHEELNDPRAAQEAYQQALELRPNDPEVLHPLLEIYTLQQQWNRAVNVLEHLVGLETGKDKARTMVALANILNYEMNAPVEAIELYEQVLDLDPDDKRSFERIERIMTKRQDWAGLSRAYGNMLKRMGDTVPADKQEWHMALWRGMAEVARVHQQDYATAAAAYEVCLSLSPDDKVLRELLVESFEAQGPEGLAGAVKIREEMMNEAPDAEGVAKQIRILGRLYSEAHHYDKAFCACAALCALMKANTQEKAFYVQHAMPGVPLAKAGLNEGLWQNNISSTRRDWRISQILAAVSTGVAMSHARDAQSLGLDMSVQVDLANDSSSVSQILTYASQLIGVPLPSVYVPPSAQKDVEQHILMVNGQVLPAFVLGQNLVTGRTDRELAFLLAKNLVNLRADHFLLCPNVVSGLDELRVVLGAAMKLVRPEFDLPNTDFLAIKKYMGYLQRTVPQPQLIQISAAVEQLAADPGSIDLAAWIAGGEEDANRAALLACGDIVAAAREIVKEARTRKTRPDEAILGLARWGVTAAYMDLRDQLGLALVADSAEAQVTPPPRRQEWSV